MKKTAVILVLLLCGLAAILNAQTKTYTFVAPIPKGFKGTSIPSMLKDVAKSVEKKTGLKLQINEYVYDNTETLSVAIPKFFKDGKADFGMIFSQEYVRYKQTGDKTLVPIFTILMNNKIYMENCMYTRKSDNIKTAADLRGRKWAGSSWVASRYFLYHYGIDEKLNGFFSKLVYMEDTNTTALGDALLDNKIDVFLTASINGSMLLNSNKKYKAIAPFACVEFDHNWIFVRHKNTDPNIADSLTKLFLKANTDPAFAQFKFILSAIKGKFVLFDPQKLKNTEKLVKLIADKGWLKEEKAYKKAYGK